MLHKEWSFVTDIETFNITQIITDLFILTDKILQKLLIFCSINSCQTFRNLRNVPIIEIIYLFLISFFIN